MSSIILLDADILVYECAHRAQTQITWLDGEESVSADYPAAQEDFKQTVRSIIRDVDAIAVVVVLSEDNRAANFRRHLYDGYKRAREGAKATPRPLLFNALRAWITETYDAKIKPGIEADDTLGILATMPERAHLNQVICSIDKDLRTIPGNHYNWRKPDLGIEVVDEDTADWNHLFQTLVGDSTDGYPGCPSIGKKRAPDVLAEGVKVVPVDAELVPLWWGAVVACFEKKGLTAEDALVQARLARILRAEDFNFDTGEPILWTP
ncbi:MAG: hypothetical protein V3S01_06920 [Dehalococcoidia bacterium]